MLYNDIYTLYYIPFIVGHFPMDCWLRNTATKAKKLASLETVFEVGRPRLYIFVPPCSMVDSQLGHIVGYPWIP